MPVHIRNLRSRVQLMGGAPQASSGSTSDDELTDEQLREALRPVVMQILEEELDLHRRTRG